MLYGPALVAAEVAADTVVETSSGDTILPEGATLEDGYVYVGEARLIDERAGYRLVGGSTVVPWIVETVSAGAEAAFPLFTSMFGPLSREPIVAITDDAPGPMAFHGDVTENGFVFLRFHGDVWNAFDPGAADLISTFIRHEAFHLWNRDVAPGTPPWLHEGGAEYAAVVAAIVGGVLTESEARERLSQRVGRCRAALGERPMSALEGRGSAIYDCGVTVQWLADLGRRSTSDGRAHVFTIWSTLLKEAPASGYTLEGFEALAGPVAQRFIDGAGWTALVDELGGLGVDIDDTPDPREDRGRLLNHLMAESCDSNAFGFWHEDGFVRLDTGAGCGALSNKLELTEIESASLDTDPSTAMLRAIARCEAGKPVRATTRENSTLELPCARPPTRTPGFRILRAPALAPPSTK